MAVEPVLHLPPASQALRGPDRTHPPSPPGYGPPAEQPLKGRETWNWEPVLPPGRAARVGRTRLDSGLSGLCRPRLLDRLPRGATHPGVVDVCTKLGPGSWVVQPSLPDNRGFEGAPETG